MNIVDLKLFAEQAGVTLKPQKEIAEEASKNITSKFNYNKEQIKKNFDSMLYETEKEAYKIYLGHEQEYGEKVFKVWVDELMSDGRLTNTSDISSVLGANFKLLNAFFLSLSQSRKSRAGKSFEDIHNALFKKLSYPFDEQRVINGKPDFIMPSYDHYINNAPDCIIFTAKRTLRERWRQITTEGTRGLGFFLATIDEKLSSVQLAEMQRNRIFIVCPENIKEQEYGDMVNVLSFKQFFKDYLDPAMERWTRNGII